MFLSPLDQKEDSVVKNRDRYVGGSDVPTILGINKYKTQYELALEKTGIKPSEFKGNEYTSYGNALEPQIREFINIANDMHFVVDSKVDEERHIRSNVDGVDWESKTLLEIKTHGKNPNLHVYKAQMQLYMWHLGLEEGWLAMYARPDNFDCEFDKANLQIEIVPRDDKFIQEILDSIETFWIRCEYLKANPEMGRQEYYLNGTDVDLALAKLNKVSPKIIELKAKIKELETTEKAIKDTLYQKMYENDIKKIETLTMTATLVRPTKAKKLDSKALKENYPELFDLFSKEIERKGYVMLKEKEGKANGQKANVSPTNGLFKR